MEARAERYDGRFALRAGAPRGAVMEWQVSRH
jgi:hypothetical protein